MYFYYSYVVKNGLEGAREVCGRCFTRDLGNAPRGPDYLARGCSGRKLLLVRGYFCTWILICDPEESNVLLATHTREHVKFVGDVLHVTLLHVSFVPFIYRTCIYVYIGAIIDSTQLSMVQMGEVCTSVLFHSYGTQRLN